MLKATHRKQTFNHINRHTDWRAAVSSSSCWWKKKKKSSFWPCSHSNTKAMLSGFFLCELKENVAHTGRWNCHYRWKRCNVNTLPKTEKNSHGCSFWSAVERWDTAPTPVSYATMNYQSGSGNWRIEAVVKQIFSPSKTRSAKGPQEKAHLWGGECCEEDHKGAESSIETLLEVCEAKEAL